MHSPRRKRLHVRSKKLTSNNLPALPREEPIQVNVATTNHQPSRLSLSLSHTPEIEKIREDLAKVVILTFIEGFVNGSSILEVAPTIINRSLAGPITPLNECSFSCSIGKLRGGQGCVQTR